MINKIREEIRNEVRKHGVKYDDMYIVVDSNFVYNILHRKIENNFIPIEHLTIDELNKIYTRKNTVGLLHGVHAVLSNEIEDGKYFVLYFKDGTPMNSYGKHCSQTLTNPIIDIENERTNAVNKWIEKIRNKKFTEKVKVIYKVFFEK